MTKQSDVLRSAYRLGRTCWRTTGNTDLGRIQSRPAAAATRSILPPTAITKRSFETADPTRASSPFDPKATSNTKAPTRKLRELKFVPLKPAVELTDKARRFFIHLLEQPPRPEIVGVRLNYDQPSSGEPRMVFSFDFVTQDQLGNFDEAVPLLQPAPPKHAHREEESEMANDNQQPMLYVSGNAFLKVLGSTVDIDSNLMPILFDKEGNRMDPNA